MTLASALHHRVDGPEGAPSLVLLHAIGTSMRMWAPQVPELSRDHRLISIDLRGHGQSPAPLGPYAMADLALDVIDVLDRLEIQRASICGLSLGAMVGLAVAASVPDRIDRLIAAALVAVPTSPTAWLERAQRMRAGGAAAISDLVVERWGYEDRAPAIAELVRAMLAATPPEGYAGCCEAIAGMDLRPSLPRVMAPALLIAGSDDPAAPSAVARELAALMPAARVTVIDGAAHLVNVEAPTATTEAILEHLRR
jgi:3-oxoadipate enol-lactonase